MTNLFTLLQSSKKKFVWFVNSSGAIRARLRTGKKKETFCPLTAASYLKNGKRLALSETVDAGVSIGVRGYARQERIVNAADTITKEPKLRQRILTTVGLPS